MIPLTMASDGVVRRSRANRRPVVLVGFQEQANLGLGYLAATLRQHGDVVHVFDFEQDADEIAREVARIDPVVVGFSLIFQFYLPRFRDLATRSRATLDTVETVIVDEIHALARDKRGSHLCLTLERLVHVCAVPPARVGLSATQKPIEVVAALLVGARTGPDGRPR